MKTPEQIAQDHTWRMTDQDAAGRTWIRNTIAAAIEFDRAQRVSQDWEDDIENFRECDRINVEITGLGLDADGKEFVWFATDFSLTEAQMVGMFRGIGRAEA